MKRATKHLKGTVAAAAADERVGARVVVEEENRGVERPLLRAIRPESLRARTTHSAA